MSSHLEVLREMRSMYARNPTVFAASARLALDAAIAALSAAPVSFDSAEALADWLESLHEANGPAVMPHKWEPAQRAARAIREGAPSPQQPAEPVRDAELPGMWSAADLAGGDPDERCHAQRSKPAEPQEDGGAVDYVPGELDRTAPARIWLQIDTTGDNNERDEPWDGPDHVTWQDESIGGLEIQYVRADLTTPQPAARRVTDEALNAAIDAWDDVYDGENRVEAMRAALESFANGGA